MERVIACFFLTLWMLISGCSRLETEYGRTVGVSGKTSIAGFGVLREFYHRNGWTDRTLSRLNERVNNVDTIVWTPNAEQPLSSDATDWFEDWLARGDKTLIYVLKDHRTEYEYWKQASRLAPPPQRLEYRRRLARAKIARDRNLLARPGKISNGWFTAVPLNPPALVQSVQGSWSESLTGFDDSFELEYQVREFDRTADMAVGGPAVPTPWGTPLDYSPSDLNVNFAGLLKNQDGIPIVTEITHDSWPESQILVVSAGSLLTNFGLTKPGSQNLAAMLLAESGRGTDGATPKVGFLASGPEGVQVSSLNPEAARSAGLDLFRQYPLNVVTMHFIVLLVLVLLMLYPIFGRPQRIPPRPTADFAAHIDAVAGLMRRAGGLQYAKTRISEYLVRVRGETDGPWIIKQREQTPSPVGAAAESVESERDHPLTGPPQAATTAETNSEQETTIVSTPQSLADTEDADHRNGSKR